MAKSADDKQQIGLTPEADDALKELTTQFFASQTDAYRFAISYAIAADLDPGNAPQSGYVTKYNALGTLESGSSLRDLLEILEVGESGRPFATAEKLAELGVRAIPRRLEGSESFAEIRLFCCTHGNSRRAQKSFFNRPTIAAATLMTHHIWQEAIFWPQVSSQSFTELATSWRNICMCLPKTTPT